MCVSAGRVAAVSELLECGDAAPRRPLPAATRTFVGALAQLLVVAGLLHDVHDRVGQLCVCVCVREEEGGGGAAQT